MSNEQIFKENLDFLHKLDTKLAYKLMSTDPADLQLCRTKKGELNLSRTYEGKTYYYHSIADAQAEADQWFAQLDLNNDKVLFIYGIGLGYYYQAAQKWLKQDSEHAIVFLEEDPGVIYRLLETELGGKILRDPQIQLFFFQDLVEDKALFNELSWTFVDLPFAFSCLKLYEEVNSEGVSKLHHKLSFVLVEKSVFAEEYLKYGVVFYRNFYRNLLELPNSYLGNGMFGQFENVPAIICGAGPSLDKQIDTLQNVKDKALVFAGSSSLGALVPKGFIPHFGAGVDPNQGQHPRVELTAPYKVPFFYRSRLFNLALKSVTGAKIYLTGAGGYDAADWFENELGIEGTPIEEGHNIVTFCLEIAKALGCNPIVLVGLDLAYTNKTTYSQGIIESLKLVPQDWLPGEDFASRPVMKKDIYGQPTETLWKWINESEWISDYAGKNPELNIINATEGGIGFEGVTNQTLKEATGKFRVIPDLKEQISQEIKANSLSNITREQVVAAMQKMQASIERSIVLLDQLITATDHLAKKIENNESYPQKLETPRISLLETDIQDEPAYIYILNIFNEVYILYHNRDIRHLQSVKNEITQKERDLKKLFLQKGRLTFIRDVARLNRELLTLQE